MRLLDLCIGALVDMAWQRASDSREDSETTELFSAPCSKLIDLGIVLEGCFILEPTS